MERTKCQESSRCFNDFEYNAVAGRSHVQPGIMANAASTSLFLLSYMGMDRFDDRGR